MIRVRCPSGRWPGHCRLPLYVTCALAAGPAADADTLRLPHHNHPAVEILAVAAPGANPFLAAVARALAEMRRTGAGPDLRVAYADPSPATAALLARTGVRGLRTLSAVGAPWAQDFGEFAADGRGPIVLATHAQVSPRALAEALARADGVPLEARPAEAGGVANGGGNVEALPDGIALVGNTAGPQLRARLADAYGPALETVDTGWLDVGHVDEIVSSILTGGEGPCRFALVRASPRAALELLRQPGAMDGGALPWYRRRALRAALTPGSDAWHTQQVLEQRLAGITAGITARVAALDPACPALPVVKLPVLYTCRGEPEAPRRCRTVTSNPLNMVVLGRTVLAGASTVPALDSAVAAALAAAGQRVVWLDDRHYRELGGGVHCALNVRRDLARRIDPGLGEVSRVWPGSPPSDP